MQNAPSGYTPWFFACKKNGKDPDTMGSWHDEKFRLNKKQCIDRIKLGGNIGISARKGDALIIGDIDELEYLSQMPKETLTVTSRKRDGGHFFGWDKDGSAKINLPTNYGELRSCNQYVLACGSYTPFDHSFQKDRDAFAKLTTETQEDKLLGFYTINNKCSPREMGFDDLPEFFKNKEKEDIETETKILQKEEKQKYKNREGKYTELFKLKVSDIIGLIPSNKRVGHPLHESDTDANWSLSQNGEIGHCWRHLVSLNAVQYLCVKVGYMDCLDAGTPHKGRGISKLRGDKKAFEIAYNEALKIGLIKEWVAPKDKIVIMSKFNAVPFAEKILEYNHLIYDKNKIFWRYDNEEGIWKNYADQFIRTELRLNLFGDEQQKKNYVDEIIHHLRDITYNEKFIPDDNPYLIAFKNKVFDLKNNKFKDFSHKYFITNKIDIDVDEKFKECPVIDSFFCDSVGKEYKDILYDLAAYCLFREMPYQKLFFIFGQACTGKSQYLDLLEKFLGSNNYCSVEPQDIQKDIHAGSQMWLKSANIVSDIDYNALDNINQVKKITGGDTMKIRQMYKDPFNDKIFAKQIYSTNKLPAVKEKTRAWYRRVYPIEFSNVVSKEKQDPFLLNKMTTSKELSGFLWKCIEKLKELANNRFIFTWDIDEIKVAKMYEELSNPILMFINENCGEKRGNSDYWVYQYEFKERLNNWLHQKQFPKMTNSQINEYMTENYNISNRPNLDGNKTYRVFVGVKWEKSSHNPTSLNHFNHFSGFEKKLYMYRRSFQTPPFLVKMVKSQVPPETKGLQCK